MPDDEVLRLLREMRADVHELLDLVSGRKQSQRPSAADRDVLRRLFPAIAGELGSAVFASADLRELAGPRCVLVPLDHWTPKRIGKLLARAADAGVVVNELRVVRLGGSDRAGQLWHVVARI